MSKISKTVTVELLRHGRAHNQLLSPLTNYLGLCGNFGAASVRVPYEHQHFLSRLNALRYTEWSRDSLTDRKTILDETAQQMTGILASLKGLISGLGAGEGKGEGIVHLNLVLSAAELAMLPFELVNVPPGCAGGEGKRLLRQSTMPVTMTRQIRNVTMPSFQWPGKPRILCIIAAPGNLEVPELSHIRALVKSIKPWLSADDRASDWPPLKAAGEYLTIITQASRKKIEEEMSARQYTHVHILAHGAPNAKEPGEPYGLALHKSSNPNELDIVSGESLSEMLRPSLGERGVSQRYPPMVVTIAACDSGNIRDVISSNGASIAHDLHQAGVPFVVASQFPLSKKGSVYIPKTLYPDLLWGEDPRVALARLRCKLSLHVDGAHDWASLVAYASLPENLAEQLEDVKYEQSKRGTDAAMSCIDAAIKRSNNDNEVASIEWDALLDRVDEAIGQMPMEGRYETEGTGMRASTDKRKAEAKFKIAMIEGSDRDKLLKESIALLEDSKETYRQAFETTFRESKKAVIRRSTHWVLGQYLSLCTVLGEDFKPDYRATAFLSCRVDLGSQDKETVAWAHGTMAELYLLELAYREAPRLKDHQKVKQQVLNHIGQLIDNVAPGDFAIRSTRRQFDRYVNWWSKEEFRSRLGDISDQQRGNWREESDSIAAVAKEVVEKLQSALRGRTTGSG